MILFFVIGKLYSLWKVAHAAEVFIDWVEVQTEIEKLKDEYKHMAHKHSKKAHEIQHHIHILEKALEEKNIELIKEVALTMAGHCGFIHHGLIPQPIFVTCYAD